MKNLADEVRALERALRSSYAAQRGLRTVDIELDEEYRPVRIRHKPLSRKGGGGF